MVNFNYKEGIDELRIKVRERNAILTETMRRIGNFFAEPGPNSRLELLNIYSEIRELLGEGGDWGDV